MEFGLRVSKSMALAGEIPDEINIVINCIKVGSSASNCSISIFSRLLSPFMKCTPKRTSENKIVTIGKARFGTTKMMKYPVQKREKQSKKMAWTVLFRDVLLSSIFCEMLKRFITFRTLCLPLACKLKCSKLVSLNIQMPHVAMGAIVRIVGISKLSIFT
jgi:hypothetical protein